MREKPRGWRSAFGASVAERFSAVLHRDDFLRVWSFWAGPIRRSALWKAAVIGAGLSAFQWIPFIELFRLSARPLVLNPSAASAYSEPGAQLLRMLILPQWFAWMPQLSGDPAVVSFYIGPFALLTAVFAFSWGGRTERYVGAGILACFVLSLGVYCPGYSQCPPLHIFRFPANWLLPAVSAIMYLSAVGISRFPQERWKWMTVGLLAVDLLAFAQYVRVPWFPTSFLQNPPPVLQQVQEPLRTGRLYHSPPVLQEQDVRSYTRREITRA